jgi:hypothetical protein
MLLAEECTGRRFDEFPNTTLASLDFHWIIRWFV